MARRISLAAYTIKVRNKDEKEDVVLSRFGDDVDFLDFVGELLSSMKGKTAHDEERMHVLTVRKLSQDGRTLAGIVETGEYGVETNIFDVESRSVVHRRRTSHADLWPFYFYIEIPEGADEGLLILQRTGNYGIRKVLQRAMKASFDEELPSKYRLSIDPVVEPEEIEKYAKGRVQEVRFFRFKLPAHIEDAYDSGHKEVHGQMELVIRARRGGELPMSGWFSRLMKSKKAQGLFVINEQKFDYDNVKVKARVGGTSRTINVADPMKLRSYFDISDKIRLGSGGHPVFQSIHDAALELAVRLKKQIYGDEIS